ncbi:MAG: hypothetical protein IJ523_00285 [Succinivibrionaceae bacterium]|nr:hypothetical protein [Succinivibrionaceae bacterium]
MKRTDSENQLTDLARDPSWEIHGSLWNDIDQDCFLRFEDLPANYNQVHEVRILRDEFRMAAYDYTLNNVFYPGDLRGAFTAVNVMEDMKRRILLAMQSRKSQGDNVSGS